MASAIFIGDPRPSVKAWMKHRYYSTPLTFTSKDSEYISVHLDRIRSPSSVSLEYSTDHGVSWTEYEWDSEGNGTLILGDRIMIRAKTENQTFSEDDSNFYQFGTKGRTAVSGNIQTLLKSDGSRADAPAYCYASMFLNCSSIEQAPVLTASQLAYGCYSGMFEGCTSLVKAPALNAAQLDKFCYSYMFKDCTSLVKAPALPASAIAEDCYIAMFQGCTSLSEAPALPASVLAKECYMNMFTGCTSLAQAPALNAATLSRSCYREMFKGCTSLTSIEIGFESWYPANATIDWVANAGSGVSGEKTFTCPAVLPHDDANFNDSMIPAGWTVQTK